MNLIIDFNELSALIKSKADKELTFQYVDQQTVTVSASVKVMGINVTVPLNISIEGVSGTSVALSYTGRYGLDLLVTGLMKFIEAKLGGVTDFVKYQGEQRLVLYLDKIDKLKAVFDVLKLDNIFFQNNTVVLIGTLK